MTGRVAAVAVPGLPSASELPERPSVSIHDALRSSTLSWRAVRGARPGYDLVAGSDALATARVGEVEVGGRLYRTESRKGGVDLVDVATGARVASVREMHHHVTVVNVHQGRYRVSRAGVLPFMLTVTADYGGPQLLQVLRLGPLVRIRKGSDVDAAPTADVDLLAVLVGMSVLGLLAPTATAAA